ncbi:sulfite exporter TauE/SafE family protein [Sphaerisporangium sp. TRM90804]|uniref:sulfite exporter TauE/SafE family protein n=1 Tax=Sphaerisporangium sp. TRM90804 TaxID=3031113 RepID=UPI00244AE385|nr:sulfite exporter TauE/SafE family protein [Sphaerisporangium sp. TRM90804]MDH2429492.1 sulfite exporter TauE/SafE family protein [Sphaerisporangium sp. TRM90804]
MTVVEVLGLIGVGLVAGVVSSVVSLASVVSYPALLAFGLPPLAANVTNTVSLVFSGLGAAAGSRPELSGHGVQVLRLAGGSVLGGAAGAALLLLTPSRVFELAVPWLIGLASLALFRRPRAPGEVPAQPRSAGDRALRAGVAAVAVYVGYFGAAGGLMMFALLSSAIGEPPARLNAFKNVLTALANLVAAAGFAVFGPVQWAVVVPLATGFLAGGWLGPGIVRRMPGQTLRVVAALCGIAVAVKLGLDAYR